MKVIFLDIDGVLNNYDLVRRNGFDYIDPDMVVGFSRAVRGTGADIVLSSFWRLDLKDRALVDAALSVHGMSVRARTPSLFGPRANEISSWLGDNPWVKRYAILDDDEGAGVGMEHSFFQTDPEIGITGPIIDRLISHLNGGSDV